MRAGLPQSGQDVLSSALDWWALAGVDVVVDEAPRDWLKSRQAPSPASSPLQEAPRTGQLPGDLSAFQRWLADPANFAIEGGRIAPSGAAGADIMVISDMPDMEDQPETGLLSAKAGLLFDAMMRAIGRARADLYIASLLPVRSGAPLADRIAPLDLVRICLHHIGLVRPKAVLLLGDATSRALLGTSLVESRARQHFLNHDHGSTAAVATFHPRFLLGQPAIKADAWADLRLLKELITK